MLLQVGEGRLETAHGLGHPGARGGDVEAQEALAAGAEAGPWLGAMRASRSTRAVNSAAAMPVPAKSTQAR